MDSGSSFGSSKFLLVFSPTKVTALQKIRSPSTFVGVFYLYAECLKYIDFTGFTDFSGVVPI